MRLFAHGQFQQCFLRLLRQVFDNTEQRVLCGGPDVIHPFFGNTECHQFEFAQVVEQFGGRFRGGRRSDRQFLGLKDIDLFNALAHLYELHGAGGRVPFDLSAFGPFVGIVMMIDIYQQDAGGRAMDDDPDIGIHPHRPKVRVLGAVEFVKRQTVFANTTPSNLELPDPDDPSACSAWLQARYMKSDRDAEFMDALEEILETDSQGRLTAKPLRVGPMRETRGLMVLGKSGYGKSTLVIRNLRNEPAIGLTEGDKKGHALRILVEPEATLKGVALAIATAVGYPKFKVGIQTVEAWEIALHRLALREITILWIDEAHHLLTPGPGRDLKVVVRRLKGTLQGPNPVALILTGDPELYNMVLPDAESDRRFSCLHLLPITTNNDAARLGRYLDMCCEMVGMGTVADPSFVDRLLVANHRNLGKCIEMTLRTMRRARRRPERQLTLADFRVTHRRQDGNGDLSPFDDDPWPMLKAELERRGWAT